jgi:hypothetical protein
MLETLVSILLGFIIVWALAITYFMVQLFRLVNWIFRAENQNDGDGGYFVD